MRLKDTVAIVTGATSGLGEAIAKRMAQEGAKVAIVGRNEERGEKVVSSILKSDRTAKFFSADVTEEQDVKEMINSVITAFGRIDTIINNAGLVIPGDILTTNKEEWEKVFDVNVTSTYLVSHYAIPHLLKNNAGTIINISSEAGLKGLKNRAAYCAAKSAVIGLTKAMTVDYSSKGIRVNCICPGTIETPMITNMLNNHKEPDQLMAQFLDRRVTPHLGSPEEVAEACVYFSLPQNKYVTGAILSIDGGALAK